MKLRQTFLRVKETELNWQVLPSVAASRSLQDMAIAARHLFPDPDSLKQPNDSDDAICSSLFALLSTSPDGRAVLDQLEQFLERYSNLSSVATDLAVPTWRENPYPVRQLFARFFFDPPATSTSSPTSSWKTKLVQERLRLLGQANRICHQLRAELRRSVVALELLWLQAGVLHAENDIFFLTVTEIRQLLQDDSSDLRNQMEGTIAKRRSQLEQYQQIHPVPDLVYGQPTNQAPL